MSTITNKIKTNKLRLSLTFSVFMLLNPKCIEECWLFFPGSCWKQIILSVWVSALLCCRLAFFFFLSLQLLQIPTTTTGHCPKLKSVGRRWETKHMLEEVRPQYSIIFQSLKRRFSVELRALNGVISYQWFSSFSPA